MHRVNPNGAKHIRSLSGCITVSRRKFEKTFSALKIDVQIYPFTFLHILKNPKSLTSKPNHQGSMITITYIWSQVDYMVSKKYHSLCNVHLFEPVKNSRHYDDVL